MRLNLPIKASLLLLPIMVCACTKSSQDLLTGLWQNEESPSHAIRFDKSGALDMDVRPARLKREHSGAAVNWAVEDPSHLKLTISVMGASQSHDVEYRLIGDGELTLTLPGESQSTKFKRADPTAFDQLPPDPPKGWTYRTEGDKLRGTTDRWATAKSGEVADGSTTGLVLRERAEDGFQLMFTSADNLYFDCTSRLMGCEATLKFDDEAPRPYHFTPPQGSLPDSVFLSSSSKLAVLERLRHSHRLLVEFNILNQGRAQYEFATSGLEWK